jgi:hypothetical protein
MIAELAGATFTGSLETARGGWLYRFERDDDVVIVAWSLAAGGVAELPARPRRVVSRDGVELRPPDGTTINTGPSPVYYVLDD